jgi:hypothetical protein
MECIMNLYRVVARDGLIDFYFGKDIRLQYDEYQVIKETPHGYWIDVGMRKRWVSKTSTKRFAHTVKKEALESFVYKKVKHIAILEQQLNVTKQAMTLAISKLDDDSTARLGQGIDLEGYRKNFVLHDTRPH